MGKNKYEKRWHEVLDTLRFEGKMTSRSLYNNWWHTFESVSHASNILRQLCMWGYARRKKVKNKSGRHGVIYEYSITKKGIYKLKYHGYIESVYDYIDDCKIFFGES